jgi:hypothetical protein
MDDVLAELYELAINPFAAPARAALSSAHVATSGPGQFEACEVCFDPGFDPLDPPPPPPLPATRDAMG